MLSISQIIAEALEETEGEFKHDFQTLSRTVGPCAGWEDYSEMVRKEAELRRSGSPNARADRPYVVPKKVRTGEPFGPKDQFGRVVPWQPKQVIDALENYGREGFGFIGSIARKYTSGAFRHSGFDFDDAVQLGRLGILRAIDEDELRPDNSFVTMATRWIRAYIANGFGDPKYRKARGWALDLYSTTARFTPGADAGADAEMVTAIQRLLTQPRGKSTGPLDSGEYEEFEAPLRQFGEDLISSIKLRDATTFQRTRVALRDYKKELDEQEELNRTPGAKTSDTIRTSHVRGPIRTKGLEVTNPNTGEVTMRQGLPTEKDNTVNVEQREAISLMLGKAGLSTQQLKVVLRIFGLNDWPGKGTEKDPELDSSSKSGLSLWATPDTEVYAESPNGEPIMGLGMREMDTNEICDELRFTNIRCGQHKRKALQKLSKAIEDTYVGYEDDPAFGTGEVDQEIVGEVRMIIGGRLISEVYAEPFPEVIFS